MFIIDKVLTMLLLPTALMVECALLGLLLSRWLIGRALLIVAIGALTACLILPVIPGPSGRWKIGFPPS